MVGHLDITTDGVFQLSRRAVYAEANLLFGQRRKPALHQIEPGSAGGREVHVKTRVPGQPAMNQRRFVRGSVAFPWLPLLSRCASERGS